MEWPSSSPDLYCIANSWSDIEAVIYEDGKRYTSKGSCKKPLRPVVRSWIAQLLQD